MMQARGVDGVVRSISLFVSSGRESHKIVADTAEIPSASQMDVEKREKNREIKVVSGKESLRCVEIAKKASYLKLVLLRVFHPTFPQCGVQD